MEFLLFLFYRWVWGSKSSNHLPTFTEVILNLRDFKVFCFESHILSAMTDGLHLLPPNLSLLLCPDVPWKEGHRRSHIIYGCTWVCVCMWLHYVCNSVSVHVSELCECSCLSHCGYKSICESVSVSVPCLCMYIYVCLFFHRSVYIYSSAVCLSDYASVMCLCICQYLFVSVCLYQCAPVCIRTSVGMSESMSMSVSESVCLSVSVDLGVYVRRSVWQCMCVVCISLHVCVLPSLYGVGYYYTWLFSFSAGWPRAVNRECMGKLCTWRYFIYSLRR